MGPVGMLPSALTFCSSAARYDGIRETRYASGPGQQQTPVRTQPPGTQPSSVYVRYDIYLEMSPEDKVLLWLSGEVKTPPFSTEARLEAGFLLRRLQGGEALEMPRSRPMPSIGRRCHELRIIDEDATWRIVYFVDDDAIVILEVFSKKTRATPKRIIDTCKQRLAHYKGLRDY